MFTWINWCFVGDVWRLPSGNFLGQMTSEAKSLVHLNCLQDIKMGKINHYINFDRSFLRLLIVIVGRYHLLIIEMTLTDAERGHWQNERASWND